MATILYRINTISQIMNEHGVWVQDHGGKAGLLRNSFRNRMGTTLSPTMLFDLGSMITYTEGLDDIAAPILQDEVDSVVKRMPNDKAPSPNGFSALFLKRCWKITKDDLYSLCSSFSSGLANLECINKSYITLVLKKDSPETVNDFWPISLLNIPQKVITKILADRLQAAILRVLHPNQYGRYKIVWPRAMNIFINVTSPSGRLLFLNYISRKLLTPWNIQPSSKLSDTWVSQRNG
jgi:hypothetical protein